MTEASDAVILISNDFSHPALSRQQFEFSWRINRLRPLATKGHRVVVVSAGGMVNKHGIPTLAGLIPRVTHIGNITVVSPPIVRVPFLWLIQSLFVTPITVFMYCKITRTKAKAIVASTVVYGAIGKAVNRFLKTTLVVDYGDPDFAREKSLSLRILRIIEELVFQRPGVKEVTCIDPNIVDYLSRYSTIKRKTFLPPGGYWKGEPDIVPKEQAKGNDDYKTVVYAGHIAPPPTYRLDLLAEAAKIVLSSNPRTTFLVVGSGDYLPELKAKTRELGISERFEFVGAVSYQRSREYIAISDVALQLLNDMCMGTKVMDYFALGRAVVASGEFHSRYAEFLYDRQNCLLVSPRADQIASAIRELLDDNDTRRELGEAAKKTVAGYDWVSQSEELWQIIESPA